MADIAVSGDGWNRVLESCDSLPAGVRRDTPRQSQGKELRVSVDRDPATLVASLGACLDELTGIVSQAAAAILAVDPRDSGARRKADESPVTIADEAAEAIILAGLARVAPAIPVVSEEAVAGGHVPSPERVFILVDPLDGTREFLAGRDEFTVNVAVVASGIPCIGLVAAPPLGLIWRGVVGGGAQRLRLAPGLPAAQASEVAAIRTRTRPQRPVAAISRSHFDPHSRAFLDRLAISDTIVCGSSVKICRIAEGAADVYPRLAPVSEWDIAAGHAVLSAAGGVVMRPDGAPLTYGNFADRFRVPGFVAWGDPDYPSPEGGGSTRA
jgi:3'(2'), 5'-bisphosphate nucleotidase